MEVLTPRLKTLDVFARHLFNMCRNLLLQLSAKSPLNISPNPSDAIPKVLEPKDNYSKYPPLATQKLHTAGGRGNP